MSGKSMTEKQSKSWNRTFKYFDNHRRFELTIGNGMVEGYFNSRDGEYVSRVSFAYDPFDKSQRDPDWYLSKYTGYQEMPPAHGWLTVGGGDNWSSFEVPGFNHPNDLYNWLKEFFGY